MKKYKNNFKNFKHLNYFFISGVKVEVFFLIWMNEKFLRLLENKSLSIRQRHHEHSKKLMKLMCC